MRRSIVGTCLLVLLSFFQVSGTHAVPPVKMQLEGFLLPESVVINSTRTLTMCLVNQGMENQLSQIGLDADHLILSLPIGPASSDLISDGTLVGCTTSAADWACTVNSQPTQLQVTLAPQMAFAVTVGA
ncbi:MAG: hypothetical protein IH978_10115 [Nitrospinae bacterium]|nr:hypothetical protein [Nitrospinota bacterium]